MSRSPSASSRCRHPSCLPNAHSKWPATPARNTSSIASTWLPPVMMPASISSVRASRLPSPPLQALALGCWLLASSAEAESVLDSINAEVRSVYEKTKNSLVRVNATVGPSAQVQIGTGFFIEPSGKLLPTASVAANANHMWIRWGGREFPIERVGVDQRANVALLRVSGG